MMKMGREEGWGGVDYRDVDAVIDRAREVWRWNREKKKFFSSVNRARAEWARRERAEVSIEGSLRGRPCARGPSRSRGGVFCVDVSTAQRA